MVAGASLAWTAAALAVASLAEEWPGRLIVAGPTAMSVGLLGVAVLMASGPVAALLLPISLMGIGIGASWAFIAQHVMSSAKARRTSLPRLSPLFSRLVSHSAQRLPVSLQMQAVSGTDYLLAPFSALLFGCRWRSSLHRLLQGRLACD